MKTFGQLTEQIANYELPSAQERSGMVSYHADKELEHLRAGKEHLDSLKSDSLTPARKAQIAVLVARHNHAARKHGQAKDHFVHGKDMFQHVSKSADKASENTRELPPVPYSAQVGEYKPHFLKRFFKR